MGDDVDVTKTVGLMGATALWVIAITLMTVASGETGGAQRALLGWSLLSGLGASLVAAWQLIERSRAKVMDYLVHQDLRMAAAVTSAVASSEDRREPTRIR